MQLSNKRVVNKVFKGTKSLLALNLYVYSLKQEDWLVIADLLKKSNEALLNKTSTWILVEELKVNKRIKTSLIHYFSYRFKTDENNKIKIFTIGGKNFYKVQQIAEKQN